MDTINIIIVIIIIVFIIITIISFILIRKRFFLSHIYRNRLFRSLTYKFYKIKQIKILTPNILINTIDIYKKAFFYYKKWYLYYIDKS